MIDVSNAPVGEDTAKEYIEYRKAKKKPLTQRAFDRAMKESVKCEALGITASEAIELTIDMGWSGVNCEWLRKIVQPKIVARQGNVVPISTRNTSITDDLNDISWAK